MKPSTPDRDAAAGQSSRSDGEPALTLKDCPSAELWVESPTDFLDGWGGKELPASFHAYAERLYRAYKKLAVIRSERGLIPGLDDALLYFVGTRNAKDVYDNIKRRRDELKAQSSER